MAWGTWPQKCCWRRTLIASLSAMAGPFPEEFTSMEKTVKCLHLTLSLPCPIPPLLFLIHFFSSSLCSSLSSSIFRTFHFCCPHRRLKLYMPSCCSTPKGRSSLQKTALRVGFSTQIQPSDHFVLNLFNLFSIS